MKKLITIFIVILAFTTCIFAIDLSVGGNLDYTHNWNYIHDGMGSVETKQTVSMDYVGFNAFFDAQYVRLTFGPSFSIGDKKTMTKPELTTDGFSKPTPTYTNLNLGVVGKYPFKVGIAKVFPMVGFDLSFNVSAKNDGQELRRSKTFSKDMKKNLNHYYFVAGVGADITVVGKFFISPTFIFGIDLKKPTSYKAIKDLAKKNGNKYSNNTFITKIGIGFGYNF